MGQDVVFLTGATGFLGSELKRQLAAAGLGVRCLMRQPLAGSEPQGIEIVRGDVSDADRLSRQMVGCKAVFHCAALVASWAPDPAEFYRTNVEGLQNVLAACRRSGVSTLVYTSSFFALGPAPLPGVREEATGPNCPRHPYQHSKLLARTAAAQARASGFPIVTLYPGVIYGPGPRTPGNLVARLLDDFRAGKMPGLLGDGSQVWSYTHVEDVARGHVLALERAPDGGEFVLGGENASLREFFRTASRLIGRPAPKFQVPLWLGMVAGGAELLRARIQGRVPAMTPGTVRLMYDSWACDSSRARSELGYSYRPLDQGLRETLRALGIPILRNETVEAASGKS